MFDYTLPNERNPFKEFIDSYPSVASKQPNARKWERFLDFIIEKGELLEGETIEEKSLSFYKRGKDDANWVRFWVTQWIDSQVSRIRKNSSDFSEGSISKNTVSGFYKPIRKFCVENEFGPSDVVWRKIRRRIPKGRNFAKDRPYTLEEIQSILEYEDARIEVVVLVFASAGIRLGGWEFNRKGETEVDYLRVGDVKPFEIDGKVVCGILTVYDDEEADEYETCITLECFEKIQEYITNRRTAGEKITDDSPLVRNLFGRQKNAKADVLVVRHLSANGVKRLIEDALRSRGLRDKLPLGKPRHEVQLDHGFRKFHEHKLKPHMEELYVRVFQGHDTGLNENYYNGRKMNRELVEKYLKASRDLTVTVGARATFRDDVFAVLKNENESMRKAYDPALKASSDKILDLESKLKIVTENQEKLMEALGMFGAVFPNGQKTFAEEFVVPDDLKERVMESRIKYAKDHALIKAEVRADMEREAREKVAAAEKKRMENGLPEKVRLRLEEVIKELHSDDFLVSEEFLTKSGRLLVGSPMVSGMLSHRCRLISLV